MYPQKRHPKPMTPYKLVSKGACERIGPQECPTPGHSPPLHGAVYYAHGHLVAPFCHAPVSWDARHLEKPSSPHAVLASLPASSLPRAENLGRTRPLDAGLPPRLAVPPRAESERLACPCPRGADGALSLVGDGRHKPKRGRQNPFAHKGRSSAHPPWFFGMRFALLMVNWDVDRLPVACRLIGPTNHPE
jgi:hypothetical protein